MVGRLEQGRDMLISRKFLFRPRIHSTGSIWALGVSRVAGKIIQKLITPTLKKKLKTKTENKNMHRWKWISFSFIQ